MKMHLFLLVLIALPLVSATEADSEEANDICDRRGFDYGVAQWSRNNATDTFSPIYELAGQETLVLGNGSTVRWLADPEVDGVVSREGQVVYQVFVGGADGNFSKKGNVPINHVFFCNYGEPEEVPEFSGAAFALAAVGAIGAVLFMRR